MIMRQVENRSLHVSTFIKSFKKCFKDGGFNMRKWATNSSDLNELICKEGIGIAVGDDTLLDMQHPNVVEQDDG
jgi:hypothetical protein